MGLLGEALRSCNLVKFRSHKSCKSGDATSLICHMTFTLSRDQKNHKPAKTGGNKSCESSYNLPRDLTLIMLSKDHFILWEFLIVRHHLGSGDTIILHN